MKWLSSKEMPGPPGAVGYQVQNPSPPAFVNEDARGHPEER